MMRQYIVAYVVSLVSFLGMDFLWLTAASSRIYKANLGPLMLDKPNLAVAGVFYLLYVIGVVVFAVAPALDQQNLMRALWGGALLGLVAYGTYDFTNQATLAGWSSTITVVDLLWGIFATAVASTIGYYVTKLLST